MEIEKLYPECKDYIWGGEKLKTEYNKNTEKTPVAESWELSFHKDGLTMLSDGRTLAEAVTAKDLGENCKKFAFFPMLIKLIDAKNNLSVQVHPSDDYALKNENSYGKTEMWYIVEAEKGAGIYLGFKDKVSKTQFKNAIKDNTLTDLLNFYEVKAGEHYFIPSGTIHAIGKGCLICEIQQNSNLTYRVYDYGRVGKDGKPRELHVEKALKVTHTDKFINKPLCDKYGDGTLIGKSEYFTVVKYNVENTLTLNVSADSFLSVTCVDGKGTINDKEIIKGDTYFVPADYGKVLICGNMKLITAKV